MFSPIVQELSKNLEHIDNLNTTDKMLGNDSQGREIFQGEGKYGPYVKVMENDKWKFASLKEETITLEGAEKLLRFPIYLGTHNKAKVYLQKGQYGLYLKCSNTNVSIKDESKNEENIDLEYAKSLLDSGDPYALKSFKLKDKVINIKKGPYGNYAQIATKGKQKKRNITIPEEVDVSELTLEQLLSIIGIKVAPKKDVNC